jgi:hypothetical protein
MNNQMIARLIIERVEASKALSYPEWTIGLTHDPEERKNLHNAGGKFTGRWEHWAADSLNDGQSIKAYFINDMGMKGDTGGNLNALKKVHIYIF